MTGTGSTPIRRLARVVGSASPRCATGPGPRVGTSPWSHRTAVARPSGWRYPPVADRIRVLIVDDHPMVRQGLRAFLDVQDDIEVVGEAADGASGAHAARETGP